MVLLCHVHSVEALIFRKLGEDYMYALTVENSLADTDTANLYTGCICMIKEK